MTPLGNLSSVRSGGIPILMPVFSSETNRNSSPPAAREHSGIIKNPRGMKSFGGRHSAREERE